MRLVALVASALAFACAVYLLPPGNVLALPAAVSVVAPVGVWRWLVRAERRQAALPLVHVPPVLGLTVFAAVVPWVNLPYRAGVLLSLLGLGLLAAYGWFSLRTRTWVPVVLSALAVAMTALGTWYLTRPE